ncbi:MAG: catalase [Candidatus Cloacimonadota bacterium]|nr:catalase [Candidatus Cloacimonadota bacterium]
MPKQDIKLTTDAGAPVIDKRNIKTAGPGEPLWREDVGLMEILARFDREVIPERRRHALWSIWQRYSHCSAERRQQIIKLNT